MGVIFEIVLNPVKFLIYLKWIIKYLFKGNWRLGTEMAFWEYKIKYNQSKKYRYNKFYVEIIPFLSILDNSFGEKSKPYNLLEIGPGPRTFLEEGYRRKLFHLKGIDPLTNEFKEHLGGSEFLVQGTCEKIDTMYPNKSFHMVYASNVLDHVEDPLKCFQNMVNATIVNGIVVIHGKIMEGSRLNWSGLHKHDLWIEQGKLMCSKRNAKPVDLSEGLPIDFHFSHGSCLEGDPWFTIIYRRIR